MEGRLRCPPEQPDLRTSRLRDHRDGAGRLLRPGLLAAAPAPRLAAAKRPSPLSSRAVDAEYDRWSPLGRRPSRTPFAAPARSSATEASPASTAWRHPTRAW